MEKAEVLVAGNYAEHDYACNTADTLIRRHIAKCAALSVVTWNVRKFCYLHVALLWKYEQVPLNATKPSILSARQH